MLERLFKQGPKKIRVLAIDDDPRITETVRMGLEALGGYSVETAGDGQAGLEAAREIGPDIIVLDVEMPRMTGLQVLEALASRNDTSGIPVIMMSGVEDDNVIDQAFHDYAECYLVKPVTINKLHDRIQTLLEAHAQI